MDTTGKNEQIEKETLGLVLEEFTHEQKTTNQTINDLIAAVNTIGSKVDILKKNPPHGGLNFRNELLCINLELLSRLRQRIG